MFSQRSDCTGMGIGLLQLHSTKSHIYPGGFMYWTVEINFKSKYLQNIRKYLPMPDWVRIRWVTRSRVSLHHGIALLGPPLDAETMQFRLILDIIFTHSLTLGQGELEGGRNQDIELICMFTRNHFSPRFPAKTVKYSCGVDTPLPLSAVVL